MSPAGRCPPEVLAQIVAKTDGVPLFVEELTKAVLEGGLLVAGPQGWHLAGPLPPFAIPATLQDSLAARLDRLAPVKEIAQLGAGGCCVGSVGTRRGGRPSARGLLEFGQDLSPWLEGRTFRFSASTSSSSRYAATRQTVCRSLVLDLKGQL